MGRIRATELPWTQQPQGEASVNWNSPLSDALLAAFVLSGNLRDAVSGRIADNMGGEFAASPAGVGFRPLTAGIRVPWAIGATAAAYTITLVEYRTAPPTSYWMIADDRENGGGYIYGANGDWYAPEPLVLTTPGFKVTSTSLVRTSQNGVVATISNITAFACSANLRLLSRYTETDPYTNGIVSAIYVHGRNLSSEEMQALYRDPWQLFAPVVHRIWVPVGGVVPSVTFVGAENITTTSVDYRVTLDYA